MVNIYLKDTGIIQPDYSGSPTPFTALATATTTELQNGEFTVSNTLTLKVTAFNFGVSTNNQDLPLMKNTFTSNGRLSTSPIKFSLTCFLLKPTKWNTTDVKDLASLRDLVLMSISRGHKDLYVEDTTVSTREDMMSIGQLDKDFGRTDSGSGSSRRHLNVRLDSFSQNENTKNLSYNLNFTLLWDLSTRE